MYARTMDDYFCRYIYKFVVIFNNIYGMNINNVYTVYINVHLYYTLPFISLNLYIFYPSCYSFFLACAPSGSDLIIFFIILPPIKERMKRILTFLYTPFQPSPTTLKNGENGSDVPILENSIEKSFA